MLLNLHAAWVGFFLGCLSGAIPGLFFHAKDWLGGYTSWRRRMTRLAHISFFGIGIINISFAMTVNILQMDVGLALPSYLLIVGAVMMPVACYLSAIRDFFRHLFFIPAMSVTIAIALFLWRISTQ